MTELEAINTLLSVIGEAPIDSLSDITINEITDSALARKALNEVSRDVQSEGWSWNTDRGVQLNKDSANEFKVAPSTLKVVFDSFGSMPYVMRGLRVYDRSRQSYDMTDVDSLTANQVVTQLDWEDMPHAAQQYITIRAARIYSDRFLNSDAIYVYTSNDEQYARSMLIRSEEREGGDNMLYGNAVGVGQGIGYMPVQGMRYRRN